MSNSNNRNERLVRRVDRLLQMYRKMDGYNDGNNAISNRPGGRFRFMTKHFLKPKDVKAVMQGKKRQLLVIEPQMYEGVSVLDKRSDMIANAANNTPKAQFGGPTFFYENGGLAVSGGGADHWVLVTPKFADDLQKFVDRLEKKANPPPKPKGKPKAKSPSKSKSPPRHKSKSPPRPKTKKPTQKQLLNNQLRLMNGLQGQLHLMGKPALRKVITKAKVIEAAARARLG